MVTFSFKLEFSKIQLLSLFLYLFPRNGSYPDDKTFLFFYFTTIHVSGKRLRNVKHKEVQVAFGYKSKKRN